MAPGAIGASGTALAILDTHAHSDLVVSVENDPDRLSLKIEDVRAPE